MLALPATSKHVLQRHSTHLLVPAVSSQALRNHEVIITADPLASPTLCSKGNGTEPPDLLI